MPGLESCRHRSCTRHKPPSFEDLVNVQSFRICLASMCWPLRSKMDARRAHARGSLAPQWTFVTWALLKDLWATLPIIRSVFLTSYVSTEWNAPRLTLLKRFSAVSRRWIAAFWGCAVICCLAVWKKKITRGYIPNSQRTLSQNEAKNWVAVKYYECTSWQSQGLQNARWYSSCTAPKTKPQRPQQKAPWLYNWQC